MICTRCRTGETTAGDDLLCDTCRVEVSERETLDLPAAEEVEQNVRKHLGQDFQMEGLLGRGGMSLVYLARERDLNRQIALKILPLQLVLGSAAVERFKREAKIAASLEHHHIVPIHRVGTTSSFLWYTMKYVKGRSLAEMLGEMGPMDLDVCIDIIGQTAGALNYAHRRGVIHRDIKPENVLVDGEGWVWVCDFGVAKAFGTLPLTDTGTTLGTPSYMSPEQCYGQALDPRSDQYSLAVLAYRCLAGETPFVTDSLGMMIRKHCLEPPPALADLRPDLPPRVSNTVLRGMSKTPDDRFPDIVEFVEALGGRVSLQMPNASLQQMMAATPQPIVTARRIRRWRRPRMRIVAAVAVPALIAGAVMWPFPESVAPEIANAAQRLRNAALAESLPPTEAGQQQDSAPSAPAGETDQNQPATPAETPVRQPEPTPPPAQTVQRTPQTQASQAPGSLWVQADPWAYVYLDGEILQETPIMNLAIPPGRHTLRVARDLYEPFEQIINVSPGETVRLTGIVLIEIKP